MSQKIRYIFIIVIIILILSVFVIKQKEENKIYNYSSYDVTEKTENIINDSKKIDL